MLLKYHRVFLKTLYHASWFSNMNDGYGFGYHSLDMLHSPSSVNWEWSKNMLNIGVEVDDLLILSF